MKSAIESLPDQQQPPIFHPAILSRAPLHAIHNIVNQFEYSTLKRDSLDRYPIEAALELGINWNEGFPQIVEATVSAIVQQQHPRILYSAAQYRLKWGQHMKELAEADVVEVMNGYDSLTGLRLFMVAAVGKNHDSLEWDLWHNENES